VLLRDDEGVGPVERYAADGDRVEARAQRIDVREGRDGTGEDLLRADEVGGFGRVGVAEVDRTGGRGESGVGELEGAVGGAHHRQGRDAAMDDAAGMEGGQGGRRLRAELGDDGGGRRAAQCRQRGEVVPLDRLRDHVRHVALGAPPEDPGEVGVVDGSDLAHLGEEALPVDGRDELHDDGMALAVDRLIGLEGPPRGSRPRHPVWTHELSVGHATSLSTSALERCGLAAAGPRRGGLSLPESGARPGRTTLAADSFATRPARCPDVVRCAAAGAHRPVHGRRVKRRMRTAATMKPTEIDVGSHTGPHHSFGMRKSRSRVPSELGQPSSTRSQT